ncbi:DUF4350 domain-containing protein [Haloferula sp.]|uniref:DUF4350 domain-containing protein n=1 Tax=Haloferula sp. TaxID=2497595 RepID=UPI003C75B25A
MKWLLMLFPLLVLASCSYEETTRETGHKGKARINPYLAAERFLSEFDYEVENQSGWPELSGQVSMVMVPASSLTARGYVKELGDWTRRGGHTVVLLSHGEAYLNDWRKGGFNPFRTKDDFPEPFTEWMEELDLELEQTSRQDDDKTTAEKVEFLGQEYEVFMESALIPLDEQGEAKMVRSIAYGGGRLTLVADARPFRNRWIGDYDHAALLLAMEESSPYVGRTIFIRNVSLSFWKLLWSRAWPAMIALILLVVFWLWKNLPRFGPLDSREAVGTTRAYDHHLEALGDFHWRLDRAEGLLRPLRDSIIERAHRLALTSGHRDADVFQLMAERAGISRERAQRAMTFERSKDQGAFNRLVADLQTIHLSIP